MVWGRREDDRRGKGEGGIENERERGRRRGIEGEGDKWKGGAACKCWLLFSR